MAKKEKLADSGQKIPPHQREMLVEGFKKYLTRRHSLTASQQMAIAYCLGIVASQDLVAEVYRSVVS